ncbi:MAG: hypothetical protein MZV63_37155 [Marinilabiliales bacterium]|nr:hypothetical protein [Marinilabiliales bacterium]
MKNRIISLNSILDIELIAEAEKAIYRKAACCNQTGAIKNTDRTTGAMLSGRIASCIWLSRTA